MIENVVSKMEKGAHLLLQFLDGLFSELSTSLSLLQLGTQGLDLLLVGLLPLVGLLLCHLIGCIKNQES